MALFSNCTDGRVVLPNSTVHFDVVRGKVLPPTAHIVVMPRKPSGLHVEVLWTSESDSRPKLGSRKHVAVILRNYMVSISCQHEFRSLV